METSMNDTPQQNETSIERSITVLSPVQALVNCQQSGKRLMQYKEVSSSFITSMKKKLLRVAKNLGIQNPPDNEDTTTIILFLFRNYQELTLAEVFHAFELYAAGTLQTKAQPFGTLNILFIGSVMNTFRAYKRSMLKPEQMEAPKQLEAPSAKSEEEFAKLQFYIIKKYVDENKKLPIAGSYEAAFQHMELTGLIKMTKEEKAKYLTDYRDHRIRELAKSKEANPFKRYELQSEIDQLSMKESLILKSQVRISLAKQYFKTLINQSND